MYENSIAIPLLLPLPVNVTSGITDKELQKKQDMRLLSPLDHKSSFQTSSLYSLQLNPQNLGLVPGEGQVFSRCQMSK